MSLISSVSGINEIKLLGEFVVLRISVNILLVADFLHSNRGVVILRIKYYFLYYK